MRPGDTVLRVFRRLTAAGVAVTGKVTGDFTLTAFVAGASNSPSWSITELTNGYYRLSVTYPSTLNDTIFDVYLAPFSGTDYLQWPDLSGGVESQDLDSIYSVAARQVVSSAVSTKNSEIPITLIKSCYAPLVFTITDQAGNPIDLSGWNNWHFGVKSQDQTAFTYSQTSGITASALGVVTVNVPEGASFFAALTIGINSVSLYYSLEGDMASDATMTTTILRGPLYVVRKET